MMRALTRGVPELRVPRRRIAVELALAGRAPRRLELAVEQREGPAGWPDVLALVEGERRFLPFHELGADRWILVNRDQVVWLAVSLEDIGAAAEPREVEILYDQRVRVAIELAGEARVAGELLFAAPSGQARAGDHLNEANRFLCLFQPDRVLLVHKAAVVELVETASMESP
jgi:hypothetical protein